MASGTGWWARSNCPARCCSTKMIEHADGMLAAMKLERGDDLISEALRFTGSDRMLSGGVVEGEVRRE